MALDALRTGFSRLFRSTDRSPRPLTLHLGSQKTGTTAAQRWCRQNKAELATHGIATLTTQPDIRKALGGWYEVKNPGSGEALHTLIQGEYGEGVNGVFYSSESNVGTMFAPPEPALYPYFTENIQAIARATTEFDRLVQFTVRSHVGFLESSYIQKLKQGTAMPFEDFHSALDPEVSWVPIVQDLVDAFGAENVVIYD
ncbi:hypothetical protein [Brevibacterium litoralis]|uniref:hypothetical protein n=1 Tax=Brevibacterium litoralis TaxID=3138935 RepID=UPI0032F04596